MPPRTVNPLPEPGDNSPSVPTAPMSWMARLHRVFAIELSQCPRCGGELKVIGAVTEPNVFARILDKLARRERDERKPRAPRLRVLSCPSSPA